MGLTKSNLMIEQKVSDTILQQGEEIVVCGKKYIVAPPTPATLIMVSAEVAKLPTINDSDMLSETLRMAKDCAPIGKIAAILILGAKEIRKQRKTWWRWGATEADRLAKSVLEDMTTRQIADLLAVLLGKMQIGDFFVLTTSLKGVNLTKSTREVGATASGR